MSSKNRGANWTSVVGKRVKAADGDHLVPRPDSDGEGAGAAAQDRVGAVVEWLKG
jgi:hypothetical protein